MLITSGLLFGAKGNEGSRLYHVLPICCNDTLPATVNAAPGDSSRSFGQKVAGLAESVLTGVHETTHLQWLFKENNLNHYEWLRIALGVQNNLNRDPAWRVYANLAYGTKDGTFKYMGSLARHFSRDRENRLEVFYKKDIERPGRIPYLRSGFIIPGESPLLLGNRGYLLDSYRKAGTSLFLKPFKWSQVQLFFQREERTPLQYIPGKISDQRIHMNQAGLNFRYAFKQPVVRHEVMEYILDRHYPLINFQILRGWALKNDDSSVDFFRFSFDLTQKIGRSPVSETYAFFSGGVLNGETPFSYLFNHLSIPPRFLGRNTAGDLQGTETGEYAYDRFISFGVVHYLNKDLIRSGKAWFQPELSVGVRAALSRLGQREVFVNEKKIRDFSRGFYESNLAVRNILKIRFSDFSLGIGGTVVLSYDPGRQGTFQWRLAPILSLPNG